MVPHFIEVAAAASARQRIQIGAALQMPLLHQGFDARLGHLPASRVFGQYLVRIVQIDETQARADLFAGTQCNQLRRIFTKRVVGGKPGRPQVRFILRRFVELSPNVNEMGIDCDRRFGSWIKNRGNERGKATGTFHQNGSRLQLPNQAREVPRARGPVMTDGKVHTPGTVKSSESAVQIGLDKRWGIYARRTRHGLNPVTRSQSPVIDLKTFWLPNRIAMRGPFWPAPLRQHQNTGGVSLRLPGCL